MKVVWLPLAEQDLNGQLDYIEQRNPPAALGRTVAVADAVRRLTTYPELGRVGRKEGTRELVVPKTPYIIVYRIDPAEVVILRFLHGAQDWPGGGFTAAP